MAGLDATRSSRQGGGSWSVELDRDLRALSAQSSIFPVLEGNVLRELRAVVSAHNLFFEKTYDGYSAFDYRGLAASVFPDPSSARGVQQRREYMLRRECRGLLVDTGTGRVLARRFHKFFNVGERDETKAANLPPLSTLPHEVHEASEMAVALEKQDGSLASPLLLGGRVRWATKKVLCPAMETFVACRMPQLTDLAQQCLSCDVCPIFEWLDPENPIVIRPEDATLVLLGLRHNLTGAYAPFAAVARAAAAFQCPVTARVAIDLAATPSLRHFTNLIARWPPGKEGVVLTWSNGLRVKIKSDWYTRAHKEGGSKEGKGQASSPLLARFLQRHLPTVTADLIPAPLV